MSYSPPYPDGSSDYYDSKQHLDTSTARDGDYDYDDNLNNTSSAKEAKPDTDFGVGRYLGAPRKNAKTTFYCELCSVELSSLETRDSHVRGAKHLARLGVGGGLGLEKGQEHRGVHRIPNPATVRQKVPVRLIDKVKKASDPVVGLAYVQEFIPVSDDEIEPRYECSLCGTEGEANSMFNHLLGRNHRAKVLAEVTPRLGLAHFESLGTAQLVRLANDRAENRDCSGLIRTHVGDELYPWPAGKAPWSIEQGGDGVAPANSREAKAAKKGAAAAKGGDVDDDDDTDEDGDDTAADDADAIDLPSLDSLGEINNANYDEFLDLTMAVVGKAARFYRRRGGAAAADMARCLVTDANELRLLLERRNMGAAVKTEGL